MSSDTGLSSESPSIMSDRTAMSALLRCEILLDLVFAPVLAKMAFAEGSAQHRAAGLSQKQRTYLCTTEACTLQTANPKPADGVPLRSHGLNRLIAW